ncbi:MAG: cation diffusion facilitator family transporter [Armatimonadia bacterium]
MLTSQTATQTSRAAGLSLFSNVALSVMKLGVGYFTGSISVLADGANSSGDIITSLVAWSAVRQGNRPPDEDHRYGHGKFEALSAAFESLIIIAAAIAIGYAALRRLLSGQPPEFDTGIGLVVMCLSALTNLTVSMYLERKARQHDSLALRAEAAHHRVDIWTSSAVLAGLFLITFTGWRFLDPLLAVIIGAIILVQGAQVGREAVAQLLDRALPPDEMDFITGLLADHDQLFVDYHRLRARKAGRERQIDVHLVTCPHVTVQEAHDVADHLEEDIRARLPLTRVVIHVEPCDEANCPNRSRTERDSSICQLKGRLAHSRPQRQFQPTQPMK